MNSKQSRWFILILLALIWGSSFILMKKALIDLSPVQVGAYKNHLYSTYPFYCWIEKHFQSDL